MDNTVWLQLLLQLFLIMLNAVFACAEIAVISANDARLSKLEEEGDKRASRLKKLKEQPAKFLATIQIAITFSGFLGSAFAADNFSDILVDALMKTGIPVSRSVLDTISVILITIILSYFTLVLGELVPKRLAMKKTEKISLGLSATVSFISKVFAPLVWLLTASTNLVLRIFGIDPEADDQQVSEEDIIMLVDEGNQKGLIDTEESKIIQNVFEFDDTAVGDFATHRTEISVLWVDGTKEDWEKTIHETRHTLYPICDETVDNIVGVLNIKDYFSLSDKSRENVMKNAVKPAIFVPDSIHADVLFKRMKQTRNHFSVVLDEYGGVVGIVTMNDLLEQLVGELTDQDEADADGEDIEAVDSNTWIIRGSTPLEKVAEELGVELPIEDYDTFSGLIFDAYGSVPEDGSSFEIDAFSLHIKAEEIKNHMIKKAVVCKTLE